MRRHNAVSAGSPVTTDMRTAVHYTGFRSDRCCQRSN